VRVVECSAIDAEALDDVLAHATAVWDGVQPGNLLVARLESGTGQDARIPVVLRTPEASKGEVRCTRPGEHLRREREAEPVAQRRKQHGRLSAQLGPPMMPVPATITSAVGAAPSIMSACLRSGSVEPMQSLANWFVAPTMFSFCINAVVPCRVWMAQKDAAAALTLPTVARCGCPLKMLWHS
jgi:hypothetical protein